MPSIFQEGIAANFSVGLFDKRGNAVSGEISVVISDSKGPCGFTSPSKGQYHFTPRHSGQLAVTIQVNGQPVPGSPFQCQVTPDLRNCQVNIQSPSQTFSVNKSQITLLNSLGIPTSGDIRVVIKSPLQMNVKYDIKEASLGNYSVEFTPEMEGQYTFEAFVGEKSIPGCPYAISVLPDIDPKPSKITGKKNYF